MRSKGVHQNRVCYRVFGIVSFILAGACLFQTATTKAQHLSSSHPNDGFIVPSRPTVSMPAGIQKTGVLQLEYGLGASFAGEDFGNQQTAPLALRFAALSRLLLAYQLLTVKSQDDRMGGRTTRLGGSIIGLQAVAFKKTGYPTFAFAYETKLLPNENKEENPGSGRVDHRALLLIGDRVGGFDLTFNAAYLNVARKDSRRRADGGLFALAFDYKFDNHFGVTGELAGQSLEYTLSPGIYPLVAVTYQVNRRLRFDAGLQFGLGAQAPRVSVVAGFVVGIANLYGK